MASVPSASTFFGAGSGGLTATAGATAGAAPATAGLGTGLAAFQNLLGSLLSGDEAMFSLPGNAQPPVAGGAVPSGDMALPAGSFMISLPGPLPPAGMLGDAAVAGPLLTMTQAEGGERAEGAGILFADAAAALGLAPDTAGSDTLPGGRPVTIAITEIVETVQITEITLAGPAPVLEIVPPDQVGGGPSFDGAIDDIIARLFPEGIEEADASVRVAARADISELTVISLMTGATKETATDASPAPAGDSGEIAESGDIGETPAPAVIAAQPNPMVLAPGGAAPEPLPQPAEEAPAAPLPDAPVAAAPDSVVQIAIELSADATDTEADTAGDDDEEPDDVSETADIAEATSTDAALPAAALVTPVPQPVADTAPPSGDDPSVPVLPTLGSGHTAPAPAPARPAAAPKAPTHAAPGAGLPAPDLAADAEADPAPARADAKRPQDSASPAPMPEMPARAPAPATAVADGPDQAPASASSSPAAGTAPAPAAGDTGSNPDMAGQDGSRQQASGGTEQVQHAAGVEAPRAASSNDFASHLAASSRQNHGASGGPPLPATHQVAVQLSRAVVDGEDHLRIQLRPLELGRIDVQLQIADGRVTAQITADNAGTLELLQRDSRGLEKALQDAGLQADSGSLSFNLRDSGRQAQDNSGARNPGAGSRFTLDAPGDTTDDDLPLPRLVPAGRVDVRV